MNLTRDQILSRVTELMASNGYAPANDVSIKCIDDQNQRIFEDEFSVVAAVYYEDWRNLIESWHESQASFVELISEKLTSADRKAWDSYLVLLTTSLVPLNESHVIHDIRYDTRRVRKLLATGDQLKDLDDLEDAFLPLLPIRKQVDGIKNENVLNRLPDVIADARLDKNLVREVVDAFLNQEPIA
ncbi:MAG TPA: hypothetical protein PKA76_18595, partial [Pirellulaceae bacterium]|nr:hypothetical protein [Pirellulaceae bacterium]